MQFRSLFQCLPNTTLKVAGVLAIVFASTQPAHAAHGSWSAGRGPGGRGFVAGRQVSRSPASATATRELQTTGGHGYDQTRTTTHSDGTANNTVTRTYDNGKTATRTGSATRNADGSVTGSRTYTGVNGGTETRSFDYVPGQ
jgi:hypothetical protein